MDMERECGNVPMSRGTSPRDANQNPRKKL